MTNVNSPSPAPLPAPAASLARKVNRDQWGQKAQWDRLVPRVSRVNLAQWDRPARRVSEARKVRPAAVVVAAVRSIGSMSRHHGAVGDGSTDDTAAIKNALDTAFGPASDPHTATISS